MIFARDKIMKRLEVMGDEFKKSLDKKDWCLLRWDIPEQTRENVFDCIVFAHVNLESND